MNINYRKKALKIIGPKTWCTKNFQLSSRTPHGYGLTSFPSLTSFSVLYTTQISI